MMKDNVNQVFDVAGAQYTVALAGIMVDTQEI